MTNTLDAKTIVCNLVFLYDLFTLNIEGELPAVLKNYQLTQEMLDEHCPSLDVRAAELARQACWYAYAQTTPNPNPFEFASHILPNALDKVKANIIDKLMPDIHLDKVQAVVRLRSQTPTQVDKDRQIQ